MFKWILFFVLILIIPGCSHINPVYARVRPVYNEDGTVKEILADKFLADVKFKKIAKTVDKEGNEVYNEIEYSTSSSSGDIINGVGKILGALSGALK